MPTNPLTDEQFMDTALVLAEQAKGWTNPNPMVGAVIVKGGVIIGQGYHQKVGSPHAEIEALKSTTASLKGATLYVNLEPCAHHGRTAPCSEAIIGSGISRVVCATTDPNPLVQGQGIQQLQAAGIAVAIGIRSKQAEQLNEAFFTFHNKQRPFIALKFAASLDGKLATHTGDSKWITNEAARTFSRSLRAKYQSILVGINTVIQDDPNLGARQPGKKDPLRIILDSRLQVPLNSQVLRDSNVLIATTTQAPSLKKKQLEQQGVQIITLSNDATPVSELVQRLRERGIISVLVEGGGGVLGSFIDEKVIDKVYAFYAPLLVGGTQAVSIGGHGAIEIKEALRLEDVTIVHFADNWLVNGYPKLS